MPAFSSIFSGLLKRQGFSATSFEDATKSSQPFISGVARGANRPPKNKSTLTTWADTLGLEGDERQDFFTAAALARCPPEIQAAFQRLSDQADRLNPRGGDVTAKLRAELAAAIADRDAARIALTELRKGIIGLADKAKAGLRSPQIHDGTATYEAGRRVADRPMPYGTSTPSKKG